MRRGAAGVRACTPRRRAWWRLAGPRFCTAFNSKPSDDDEKVKLPSGISAAALCQVLNLAGAQVPEEVSAALRTVRSGQPMSPAERTVKTVLMRCRIGMVDTVKAECVERVKAAQMMYPAFSEAWRLYCQHEHSGVFAPQHQTVGELQWALEYLWDGYTPPDDADGWKQTHGRNGVQSRFAGVGLLPLSYDAHVALPRLPGRRPTRQMVMDNVRVLEGGEDDVNVRVLGWDLNSRTVALRPQKLKPVAPQTKVPADSGGPLAQRPVLSSGTLRVVTYNVWFGETLAGSPAPEARMAAVVASIRSGGADVVCLQEVTPSLMAHILSDPWIASNFWVSDDAGMYGVAILSRARLQDCEWWSFPDSRMGRGMVSAVLHLGEKEIAVGCVHLESLSNRDQRREQLQLAAAVLKWLSEEDSGQASESCPAQILAGDFNFDDEVNMNAPGELLENTTLEDLMPSWTDASHDSGKTFDTAANLMLSSRAQVRMRCDRVLFRGALKRAGSRLIGTDPIVVPGRTRAVCGKGSSAYCLTGTEPGGVVCPDDARRGAALDEQLSESTGVPPKAPLVPPPPVCPSDHFGVQTDLRVPWASGLQYDT